MTHPTPHADTTATEQKIAALVEQMRQAERELQELTGGQLDAFTAPEGSPILLREAQEKLRLQAAAQHQAAEMQIAILNALPAHIALLDHQGVILAVNEAWRRFATANILQSSDFFIGQNYLGVCEGAHGDCAEEAQSVADGIRSVLRGDLKEFSLEYPCHSPTEQRWFRLMVTPLSELPGHGAVVMHVNVTQRRLAEEAIRSQARELAETGQTLTAVTEALGAYVEQGDWKAAMGRLVRCALDQTQSEYGFIGVVVGSTLRVLAHEGIVWDKVINRDFYEEALRNYEKVGYLEFTSFNNLFGRAITTGKVVIANMPDSDPRSSGRPSGHPPMRSFLGVPIFVGDQVQGMVALANRPGGYSEAEQRQIETIVQHAGGLCTSYRLREAAMVLEQERAKTEAALKRAEENRLAVWQASLDALITMDESGTITDFNPAAEKIFGYRAADVIGQPLAEKMIPPALREEHRHRMGSFLVTEEDAMLGRLIELSALRSDGTEFPVELTVVSVAGADRPTFLGTLRDITERKAAEELIRTRVRQQEAIAKISFEATQATALEPLFDFATRAVAAALRVELCKVLQLAPDGSHLRLVSGIGWQPGLIGVGTVGVDRESQAGFTLMSDEPIYVNDFAKETRFKAPPLLEQHQVVSGLSVTIQLRNKPWGVLGAHSRTMRLFNDPDVGFMQTVATLLAVVIERLAVQFTLTESEARMRDAQRIAHLGNWEVDLATNKVNWSEESFRIFGVDPENFSPTYEAFLALVHPNDLEAMRAAHENAVAGKGPLEIEHRIIRGDGAVRFVRERGELIHDEGGAPVALSGTVLDITDLRSAQSQAERMNALLTEAQRIAALGSWELDMATGRLLWPEETCRLFGIQPGEFGGTFEEFIGFILPEDRPAYSAVHAEITPTAPLLEAEYRIRRPDGTVRWMFERGMVTFDSAGKVTRRLGVVMDITERRKNEEQLRKLSQAVEQSPAAIIVTDLAGNIEYVNPKFTKDTGYSAEEVIGKNPRILNSGENPPELYREMWATITAGKTWRGEMHNRKKNGETYWELAAISPVLDATGKATHYLGLKEDITERRKNEEQLRLLETCVSRLNDIVLITEAEPIDDPGPRILYVNDAFVRRTGFSREEAIGQTPRLLQGPKTQRDRLDRIRAALKAWKPVREELINYTKSGEEFWLELDIVPVADATGWYTHWIAIERDVTERKLAEVALAESQRQYRDLVETSHNVIWAVDVEGRFTFLNQASRALYGLDPEEMIGRRFHEFVPEDQHQANDEVMASMLRDGRDTIDYTNRIRRQDGSIAILNSNARVVRDVQGQMIGISGMSQDITESLKAQEAIAQSEARFRGLFDQAAVGMCIASTEGVFLRTNQRFCDIVGYSAEEMLNRDCVQTTHPDDREHEAVTMAKMLAGEIQTAAWEKRYLHKDGHPVWCNLTLSLLPGIDGQTRQFVAVIEDITERRLAIEKLRHREHLLRIAGNIARMGGWSVDLPEVRITWSDAVCAIHDMPLGTVPALDQALDFYTPESRPVIESAFSLCASEGTPFDVELEVLTAKGRRAWVRSIGQAERDKAGAIRRVQGAFQDISEQKAAEEQIRALDGRLVNTLESITDAFFTIDREWRFTYLNTEAEKLLVRDRASLLGRNMWDEFPEGVGSIFQREYERAFAAMQAVSFEEYFVPLSKWFEVRAFPSTDGLAVYFHDVTDLRVSREALAVSEKEFRNLAEAMPQIVWITRPDGWTTYFNQHWMDYTGLTLDESLGVGWNTALHPEDQQVAWDAWNKATSEIKPYAIEYRLRRVDGEFRWWLARGEPQKDATGHVLKWFGTCTDIHELKVAELEIVRTNRALKLLSGCNEALIHADDEMTLLRDVCQLAVDTGGYRMAWVGYAQDNEKRSITPMAHAGVEDGYLSKAKINWDEHHEHGQGPGGRVIRGGEPIVCEDMENDPNFHWVESAQQRGYRAVTCLPLRDKHRTFGLLGLYSAEVNATNAEELKLLQEMADDLAFGILTLRTRIDQRRTHEAVLTMARGISASTGNEFFEKLTFSMVEALGAHAGFIARLNDDKSMATTLCAVVDGQLEPDFEYALSGTPCEHIGSNDVWVVPKDVQQCYPQARTLQDLGIKAYVGTELYGADGKACGLMFVLFQQPLTQHDFIASTLKIFASRAAGELERQKTDATLREQATLLDKAQDAILVRDLNHKVLYWNRSAERLYGWSAEEAVGRSAAELIYPDRAPLDATLKVLMAEGEWIGEVQQFTKDGKPLIVEGRLSLVRDEQGNPKSVLAINTDITERKKIEAQYLRAQRMESIGTLAGGIAHDLNNVLAPIMMSIELLKMQEKNPMRLSVLTTIEGSAKRGADMVKQVLSFARGVEGQKLEVQVGHLLREIEKIANETFLKNIQVSCDVPAELWLVKGDPTQLHQVLLNLCVNARDAMPDGGRITLTASNLKLDEQYAGMNIEAKPGPHVCIQVEDSGTGMPPEVIERIFEPFFTTKELGKGTGLGLSTTIAIIKSHGGFVRVYSEVGMGTRFHVYLPAQTEPGAVGSETAEPELPRGNGELVLVVDDEAAVRQITRQTLEAFGYRVLLASEGVEATTIYATRQQEIDVVLTDMMMPLMDGPTTIMVLLRMKPELRIIAASGLNANGMVAKATSAGVKHFIPKPYTAEMLLKTIREVLTENPIS